MYIKDKIWCINPYKIAVKAASSLEKFKSNTIFKDGLNLLLVNNFINFAMVRLDGGFKKVLFFLEEFFILVSLFPFFEISFFSLWAPNILFKDYISNL